MDSKLDRIVETLTEIKEDIAQIRADLNYHIKRTDTLEQLVRDELPPIKSHVDRVNFTLGSLAYIAKLAGLITVIGALAKWIM